MIGLITCFGFDRFFFFFLHGFDRHAHCFTAFTLASYPHLAFIRPIRQTYKKKQAKLKINISFSCVITRGFIWRWGLPCSASVLSRSVLAIFLITSLMLRCSTHRVALSSTWLYALYGRYFVPQFRSRKSR